MDEFDPCETIAVLNPRAVDQSRVIVRAGAITAADVSREVLMRLARCSRPGSYLARIKYADMHQLRYHLCTMVIDSMHLQSTDDHIRLANMAIREVADPKVCRWCRKTGWFPDTDSDGRETGKQTQCDGCSGTGNHTLTDAERQQQLRLGKIEWEGKRKKLYHQMLDLVWEWDREVKEAMAG